MVILWYYYGNIMVLSSKEEVSWNGCATELHLCFL